MQRYIFLLLLATLASGSVCAQRATIQGRIVAREDAGLEPVAGATVILLSVPDSGIVTGVNADEEGAFAFKAGAGKPYILKVVFMGYAPYFQALRASSADQIVNLGDIELRADENVAAVQIEARREIFTFTPDGFVLNADANLAAMGGTVLDLLRNTPSVRVDADGNVTVRGAASTQILINGRPSAQAENLEGIPSLTVEQIRVITNPGARFEAEGAGGVIDIRLKRQRSLGFNGMLNGGTGVNVGVGARTLLRYNGGVNLNFATYKWNFSFGANYMNRVSQSVGNRDRLFNETRNADYLGRITGLNTGGGYNIRLGVDYIIDSSSTVSLEASARVMDRINDENFTTDFYTNGAVTGTNERFTGGDFRFQNIEGTLAYQKQFKVKRDLGAVALRRDNSANSDGQNRPGMPSGGGPPHGGGRGGPGGGHGGMMGGVGSGRPSIGGATPKHELVAALTVTALDVQNNRDITYRYLTLGLEDPARAGAQRTRGGGDRLFIVGSVDYTHLLSRSSNLSFGVRTNSRRIDSDFLQYDRTASDTDFRLNAFASNTFLYQEQVHAAYVNWQRSAGKFDINAGLRGEYTYIKGTQVQQDSSFIRSYINPFPSAQVRYRLTDSDYLRATYGYRIDRPRGWFLNPFVDLNDSLNQRSGNTRLNPTYIHSMELGYQRQKQKMQIGTTLFARLATGVVGMVTRFEGLVAYTRPENLNQSLSSGIEVFLSSQPTSWFEFNFTTTGFYYRLSSDLLGTEANTQNLNGSVNGSFTFTLPKKWRLQLGALYTSPELTLQGQRVYYLDFNASVEKRLLKDMLRLSLSCQDLFFTNRQGSYLVQGAYYLENITRQDSRVVNLTARFMFSNGRNLAHRIRRNYRDNAPNEGGGGM